MNYGRPERVQLSNLRNFRMPDNTVRVHRGTAWENPYHVERDPEDGQPLLIDSRSGRLMNYVGAWADDPTTWSNVHARAVALFRDYVGSLDLSELRGRNVACWCPVDYPDCHADVLLERANQRVAAPGQLL